VERESPSKRFSTRNRRGQKGGGDAGQATCEGNESRRGESSKERAKNQLKPVGVLASTHRERKLLVSAEEEEKKKRRKKGKILCRLKKGVGRKRQRAADPQPRIAG